MTGRNYSDGSSGKTQTYGNNGSKFIHSTCSLFKHQSWHAFCFKLVTHQELGTFCAAKGNQSTELYAKNQNTCHTWTLSRTGTGIA